MAKSEMANFCQREGMVQRGRLVQLTLGAENLRSRADYLHVVQRCQSNLSG